MFLVILSTAFSVIVSLVLDQVALPEHKKKLHGFLQSAEANRWHKFAATAAFSAYTKIFSADGMSRAFWLRSFLLYVVCLVASFLFLWAQFPSTFFEITSVFEYGSSIQIAGWMIAIIAGFVVFYLANAQTLYFIKLLQEAPTFPKFFVLAYADIIITLTVAAFGVSSCVALYSYIFIADSEFENEVEIDFSNSRIMFSADSLDQTLFEVPSTDGVETVRAELSRGRTTKKYSELDFASFSGISFNARISVSLSEHDRSLRFEEIARAKDSIGRPGYPNISIVEGFGDFERGMKGDGKRVRVGSHTYFVGTESVLDRDVHFDLKTKSIELAPFKASLSQARAEMCNRFAKAFIIPNSQSVINFSADSDDVETACENFDTITTKLVVSPEASTAGSLGVLSRLFGSTIGATVDSLTSGLSTYISHHPGQILSLNQWDSWAADPAIVIGRERLGINIWENRWGTEYQFVRYALPAGSMIFAVLVTSSALLILNIVMLLAMPVVAIITRSKIIGRYVALEQYPFTLLGLSILVSLYATYMVASAVF